MSRILHVANDDRPIPWEACWWRLLLRANQNGHVYALRTDIPGWAWHIDHFDGRNDWTWPYKTQTHFEEPKFSDHGEICLITRRGRHYLDVLDTVPPDVSEGSRWLQITRPGIQIHPGSRVDNYSYPWPRSRKDWVLGHMTQYEIDFLMG